VVPSRRQPEGTARSDAEQALLGIERVQQREEIVLVGPPAVEENESAFRFPGGGPDAGVGQVAYRVAQASRGFGSGVSAGSTWSRKRSKFGGSERRSPSDSSGSSAVKPGPIVAISKSTPLGSRK
jgi:hypothetical protein